MTGVAGMRYCVTVSTHRLYTLRSLRRPVEARRAKRARDSTSTSLPNGVAGPTYSCGKAAFWGGYGPESRTVYGRLCEDSGRHFKVPPERDYLTRVKEAISEKSRYLSSFVADLRRDVAPAPAAGPRRPWHDA